MITIIFVLSAITTILLGIALVCLIGHHARITGKTAQCTPSRNWVITQNINHLEIDVMNVSKQLIREVRFAFIRECTQVDEELADLERIKPYKLD